MTDTPPARRASIHRDDPTVFVVDDDPEVRESLALLMQSKRMKVEVFSSAEDFCENFDRTARGCLILDYKLPGMTGLELLKRMSNDGFNLATIMITAYGSSQLAKEAHQFGGVDFIRKPFNPDELLRRVSRLLRNLANR